MLKKLLLSFLEAKKFFHWHQFGFRRSAQQNTHLICFFIFTTVFRRQPYPLAIFRDVKKAFDSLTHEILIGKLSHQGVRGEALSWFSSFLTDRSIAVEASDEQVLGEYGVYKTQFLGHPFPSYMSTTSIN